MNYTGPHSQTVTGTDPSSPKPTSTQDRAIGNYRLTKVLGQGGMGTVYEAEHKAIGKKVAVKLLLPQFSQRQDILERFFFEAKTVTDIHHENIVDVLDFGQTEEGEAYIQMEYLEGKSLASALQQKTPMPPKRIVHLALQICSALKAAHDKGIVHRDIKPDNIFLTERVGQSDYFVKVLDFGIAKLLHNEQQQAQEKGAVIGTVLYMSPEQAIGAGVDHQTDIYALGAVLFEMACGAPPFMDKDAGKIRRMHITEKPPAPRSINPELPKKIEDVILKCLAKEKKDRYQDLIDVAAALGDAVGIDPKPYFLKASQQSSPATQFLGRWWIAIVGALLFVALAAFGLKFINEAIEEKDPDVIAPRPTSPASTNATPTSKESTPTPEPPKEEPLTFEVTSKTPGAKIEDSDGKPLGVSPTTISVPDGATIKVTYPNGKSCELTIDKKLITFSNNKLTLCAGK